MLNMQYVVALVMAVVQVLKKWVPSPFLPLVAVVLGALFNALNAVLFGGDLAVAVKDGIVAAGLAIGIFSGVKNTFQARSTGSGLHRLSGPRNGGAPKNSGGSGNGGAPKQP
ncbi:MAG: holin [Firmicutes bacterium]|nr:holin [Bacillota bacterium]